MTASLSAAGLHESGVRVTVAFRSLPPVRALVTPKRAIAGAAALADSSMSDAVTEVRPHEQVLLIVVLKRSLDDATTHQLTDDVLEAAAQTPRLPIVLDLAQVRFAPSVALGALVQLNKGFKLDGRKLILIQIHPNVLGSIQVTNLHAVLEIHSTLEKAVLAQTAQRTK